MQDWMRRKSSPKSYFSFGVSCILLIAWVGVMHLSQRKSNAIKTVQPRPQNSSEEIRPSPNVPRASILLTSTFTATYLTILSIVQGAAFAYLASFVYANYHSLSIAQWLIVVTVFLLIVAVWHEYMMAAKLFVWVPTLLDSLIPFILGSTELLIVSTIGSNQQNWFLASIGFAVSAGLGYGNLYWQARRHHENDEIIHVLDKHHQISLVFLFWMLDLLFALIFWGIASWENSSEAIHIFLAGFSLALIILQYFRIAFYLKVLLKGSS